MDLPPDIDRIDANTDLQCRLNRYAVEAESRHWLWFQWHDRESFFFLSQQNKTHMWAHTQFRLVVVDGADSCTSNIFSLERMRQNFDSRFDDDRAAPILWSRNIRHVSIVSIAWWSCQTLRWWNLHPSPPQLFVCLAIPLWQLAHPPFCLRTVAATRPNALIHDPTLTIVNATAGP